MPTITQRVVRNARGRGLDVLTRNQWGSNPSGHPWPLAPDADNVYKWRRDNKAHLLLPDRPARTLLQHITVTFDSGELIGDFRKDMQTIERIGFDRFGSGFSYNWGVDMRTGMVGAGQALDAAGTHTVNDKHVPGYPMPPSSMNYTTLAIAVIGMPGDKLSKDAERAIVELSAAHVEEGALTQAYQYLPHSMFAAKDCPCPPTRDRMDEIRAAVAKAGRDWAPA